MNIKNILFLGDSHGNTTFVLKAIDAALHNKCEVIVQLGDFGIWDHTDAGIRFLDTVDDALEDAEISLYFCEGNHENFNSLLKLPVSTDGFRRVRKNILHAPRGHIWNWSGITFMAMGGAHSIDGPEGIWQQARGPLPVRHVMDDPVDLGSWWPEETITATQATEAKQAAHHYREQTGEIDVLIAHDCPLGVNIPGISGYPAGNRNRRLLAEVCDAANPKYIFCGHYHRRWRDKYNNARVEILAADINNSDQALAISIDQLKKWPED